ncbi:LysR family transcriptional regulator [Ramlibacter tataouinensis]|uniref:Transcriptional regulator, LysR family-like protein n=1 Tax=Ramlibacter tataouinensis (strain ATCC BAA-407 / DSM 14655 / LMG 21543 / TTB310) TaxID=365046 RepID=F5Y4R5_RAMTT|nr:LysR family transcriptional regulator [Ramlibacter tataouinensis]AEG91383.1 transcriptional regulator, LysR family-like protein [Ramlibacter tataouinensis TTB310]
MDTLELIKTFREVARRGSFSMAAEVLDVSKANVSKYVAELETRLGVRLLNRSTRMVSLTDAGQLLLERSQPLVDMIELTRLELQHRAREPSGRLRLTAPQGLGHEQLPELLGGFMARHPQVTVSVDLSNQLVDMVGEGIDLAIRVGRLADPSLIVRKLQRMEFLACASPAYWARRGRPAHPDDLTDHDALTFAVRDNGHEWRFEVEGEPYTVPVRSRVHATDPVPLLPLALQGLGVVYAPRLILQPHLDSGALEGTLAAFSPRDVWLHAAYAQRRHNSAALRALVAYLEERWRQD